MARNRERFERSDVPVYHKHRNLIAVVVILVVFGGAYLIVSRLWNRVQAESHLGDNSLSAVVGSTSEIQDLGYTTSSDSFTTVLLLTADTLTEVDEAGATLESAELLVIDNTTGTGTLVSIPLDTKVTSGDTDQTLAELFQSSGARACVSPLSAATNISITHVIVSTFEVWDQLSALAGTNSKDLVTRAADFLTSIRTDMDAAALVDLAQQVNDIGITRIDAPMVDETVTDADGNVTATGYRVIDKVSLGLSTGVLVEQAA
jgi:hypothetical protein